MATERYVDVTTGDNGDDGTTPALAWQTLGYAANQVAADYKVWVKASASYTADDPDTATCNLEITTPGGVTTPIVWEGYSESTGDGGVVTVDAQDTNVNPVVINSGTWSYNHFKNFRFTQGSGAGVECNGPDGTTFKNCRFDNNGGHGFGGTNSNNNLFYQCLFDNNGNYGANSGSPTAFVSCIAHSNTNNGFNIGNGLFYACCLYENGNGSGDHQLYTGSGQYGSAYILCCSLDGDDTTYNGVDGIRLASSSQTAVVIHNVIFDCQEGVDAGSNCGEGVIADANLFYSNDTNRTNFLTGPNDVSGTGDPFVDSSNNNYKLLPMSEAKCAGIDARRVKVFWDSFIAGHNPPVVP